MDLEERLAALVDDPEFQEIDHRLRRFNLFEAIGAVSGELKHSNFLAFILSPGRPHGLGTELLLRVLRAILAKVPPERRPLPALELIVSDLESTVIYREQDHIDLLIDIKELKFIVAIENKIGAQVSEGQLGRYKAVVRQRFQKYRHAFVLLTRLGTEPEDPEYVAFNYSELAGIIDGFANDRGDALSDEVALVLRHYVSMLRRNIVEDAKLAELAVRLYEKYKEAFDFVNLHQPRPKNLIDEIQKLVVSNPTLTEDSQASTLLRFAPVVWRDQPQLNLCPLSEWSKTGRSLLFEIKAHDDGRLTLSLILGPSTDPGLRERNYIQATERKDLFVGLVRPMGKKWSTIYSAILLTAVDAKVMEHDEQLEAVEIAWLNFVDHDLPALTKGILELL